MDLICIFILWRSGLGLLMANFSKYLKELSAHDTSDFSFPGDNLSKYQWIFTKLGLCIDIIVIWLGIANGQIWSIFDELSARDTSIFSFQDNNLIKSQRIFTKREICFDIVDI